MAGIRRGLGRPWLALLAFAALSLAASERASDVSPEVEGVLMAAMRKLLGEPSAR